MVFKSFNKESLNITNSISTISELAIIFGINAFDKFPFLKKKSIEDFTFRKNIKRNSSRKTITDLNYLRDDSKNYIFEKEEEILMSDEDNDTYKYGKIWESFKNCFLEEKIKDVLIF